MQAHNQEQLSNELIQLTEKQIDILEKRTFGGVNEAEQKEYEKRQERIRVLFSQLHHLDPAA